MKAIIYDFDGVICDSVDVKTKAFAQIYNQYGNKIVKKVIDHHLEHGGISRFKKFIYYHKEFLNIQLNENQLELLVNKFSDLVKLKVIESDYIKGAHNFIQNNNFLQFICTGTPEEEIIEITNKKNISSFFNDIYGSPKSKPQIIEILLNKYNLSANEVVFFGDALTDYNAALKCNIPFVGIKNNSTIFPKNTNLINHFDDIRLVSLLKNFK
jgi:HAD superfamily hydrolase (TIGR01549 family)